MSGKKSNLPELVTASGLGSAVFWSKFGFSEFRCWNTDSAQSILLRRTIHWQVVSHNFLFNHAVQFQKAIKWPISTLLVVQRLNMVYCWI